MKRLSLRTLEGLVMAFGLVVTVAPYRLPGNGRPGVSVSWRVRPVERWRGTAVGGTLADALRHAIQQAVDNGAIPGPTRADLAKWCREGGGFGRCYACDRPATGTRDRRPESPEGKLEPACERHRDDHEPRSP